MVTPEAREAIRQRKQLERAQRRREKKLPPKCRVCIPGHRCRIVCDKGDWVDTFCAICRRKMSALDLMKPKLARAR